MGELVNIISIREFRMGDVEAALMIIQNNLDSIKGLKASFAFKESYARELVYDMLTSEDFLMVVAEKEGEVAGLAIAIIHPAFWDNSTKELSELALNTSTLIDKKEQADAQLKMWGEIERLGELRGVTKFMVSALGNYSMGDRFMEEGYRQVSETFRKEGL